jgi:hypothetical protein
MGIIRTPTIARSSHSRNGSADAAADPADHGKAHSSRTTVKVAVVVTALWVIAQMGLMVLYVRETREHTNVRIALEYAQAELKMAQARCLALLHEKTTQ